ncbi:hypothetical protein LTR84_008450 [Exophiala bonariae]|uniref:Uncharacterized protein n=1 Tax=Exophiala bonariae TaxID=1690606 RepID=A0AAV9N0E9_9EURO|nr:hypothetical protein LTR84_008450 [Exophiala bonariae]
MAIKKMPSSTNKRRHATSKSLDEDKTTAESLSHEQPQIQYLPDMRRLVGTPLRGSGNVPSQPGGNPRGLIPSQQYISRIQRAPIPIPASSIQTLTPKLRRSPLPFTYGGAEVSLDPSTLSIRPDATAIEQIKLVIPVVPRMMNGQADLPKMLAMLVSHANATAVQPPPQISADVNATVLGSEVDTPGADFDLLLNSLSESGLVGAKKL